MSLAATSRAARNSGPDPTNVTWARWLRIGFWFCTVIAVAVVLRRLFVLASPPHAGPPQLVALDAVFASHAGLTLAHILPALAFVVLTPLVFMRRFTRSNWPERLLFPLGAVVGDERLFRGWMVGALGRPTFQHAISGFAGPGVPVLASRRACTQTSLAAAGDWDPVGHCYNSTGDGLFLCHQQADASRTTTVLWHRLLDRVLDQHHRGGVLASFRTIPVAAGVMGAVWVVAVPGIAWEPLRFAACDRQRLPLLSTSPRP